MPRCSYCEKELPNEYTSKCPNCGKSTDAKPTTETNVSNWWYLLPIFLTWVGGLIMYFVIKDKDAKKAKRGLILGFAITAVPIVIYAILMSIMGSMFTSMFKM